MSSNWAIANRHNCTPSQLTVGSMKKLEALRRWKGCLRVQQSLSMSVDRREEA